MSQSSCMETPSPTGSLSPLLCTPTPYSLLPSPVFALHGYDAPTGSEPLSPLRVCPCFSSHPSPCNRVSQIPDSIVPSFTAFNRTNDITCQMYDNVTAIGRTDRNRSFCESLNDAYTSRMRASLPTVLMCTGTRQWDAIFIDDANLTMNNRIEAEN